VLADVYRADVSGNGGSWGAAGVAGISTRQGGGSGRWCCTDIKAGHAVAVPRIPANFRGGRGAPSLSPGGHAPATAGDSEGRGHVSVDAGARVETPVVAGRWGP